MKIVLAVIGLGLLLMGCGQGPTVVTKSDANSSGTMTQAKADGLDSQPEPKERDGDQLSILLAAKKEFAETKAKAEEGDAKAQIKLGVMYWEGQAVEQDLKEAVKWFQKASDQGDAAAQSNFGLVYANGKGVNPDYVVAYAWCDIAAANERKSAIEAKLKLPKS